MRRIPVAPPAPAVLVKFGTRRWRTRALLISATLSLLMVAGLVTPNTGVAHEGGQQDFHAFTVAEGGSTLGTYDPWGPDPVQEWWQGAAVWIRHRAVYDGDFNGRHYYRVSFKVAGQRGIFPNDPDDIWSPPGDYAHNQWQIRAMLYAKDTQTGIITPVYPRGWGWDSYKYPKGCWGTGYEVEFPASFQKVIYAEVWFYQSMIHYNIQDSRWYAVPVQQGWHVVRSYAMDAAGLSPHVLSTVTGTGVFARPPSQSAVPSVTFVGSCPAFTDPPQPYEAGT